mmetsp:Transcript_12038/g.14022  ORF Transcript_12038/g.14022 Transcript_12038/m.14022 type:complete len:145 (+) Transcript_12038:57-491(+)
MDWRQTLGGLRNLANQVQETVAPIIVEALEEATSTGDDDEDEYLYRQHLQYVGDNTNETVKTQEDINEAKRRMLNMDSYDNDKDLEFPSAKHSQTINAEEPSDIKSENETESEPTANADADADAGADDEDDADANHVSSLARAA